MSPDARRRLAREADELRLGIAHRAANGARRRAAARRRAVAVLARPRGPQRGRTLAGGRADRGARAVGSCAPEHSTGSPCSPCAGATTVGRLAPQGRRLTSSEGRATGGRSARSCITWGRWHGCSRITTGQSAGATKAGRSLSARPSRRSSHRSSTRWACSPHRAATRRHGCELIARSIELLRALPQPGEPLLLPVALGYGRIRARNRRPAAAVPRADVRDGPPRDAGRRGRLRASVTLRRRSGTRATLPGPRRWSRSAFRSSASSATGWAPRRH